MVKKMCLTCGKEFNTFHSQIKKGGGKYCSKTCYHTSRIGKSIVINKYKVVCSICRKEFNTLPSRNRKFCSSKCYGVSVSARLKNKPKTEEHKEKLRKLYLGKTYEELHGVHKAQEMRNNLSNKFKGNGNYWYGKHITEEHKEKLRKLYLGKTLEEIYGEEKAKLIKLNMCKATKLENNPNWRGGKSFEPYGLDFNNKFREKIRERDNYCCVICNRMQEELNCQLPIHHLDYNKINNFPQNCVSLCRECHTKTNFNREHWKLFFQSLLKERYNYEYAKDQKIILDFSKGDYSG